MKFSTDVQSMLKALRAIARKHPTSRRRDVDLHIKATADGVTLETNQSSAFIAAHVGVAGACVAPRDVFTKVLATFPSTRPITIEAIDGRLHIGSFRLNVGDSFISRENDQYGSV